MGFWSSLGSALLGPVGGGLIGLTSALFSAFRPNKQSPSLTDVQARYNAEQEKEKAIQDLKVVNDRIADMERKNKEERDQANARQEELGRAAAQAAEQVKQMKEQMEETVRAAKLAEERAKNAANASKEEAAKFAREAREERERSQKIREEAERAFTAAREEFARAQRTADEQRREAEASKARAEAAAQAATEDARKAREAKEDAEKRLKEGIQPVVTPSPQDVAAAKRRIQYREDCFHFAIVGISGSGKSSLVNAFRGLRTRDAGAAAVGITETTLHMARYPDANPENPFVWYDIPGAGTLKCRDWQYFNNQGLYVFDCIIVLFDNRFTMTDVAILINARRFNIPTYIVRSKADQHIRNMMIDKGYDSEGEEEEDVRRRSELRKAARKQFIDETTRSVKTNLEDANLPNQRVYVVTNTTLLDLVLDKAPKKLIHEAELLSDLLNEAYTRRRARPVVG